MDTRALPVVPFLSGALHRLSHGKDQPTPTCGHPGSQRRRPSIAALPFANLSGDAAQDYLCDGITEGVTTALARLSWLLVIARNSAFVYKNTREQFEMFLKTDIKALEQQSAAPAGPERAG